MRILSLLSMVAISAVLALAQPPQSKAALDQELIANQNQFMKAIAEKNSAFVNQSVAEDFKGIGTNGDFFDRDEIVGTVHEGAPKDQRVYGMTVVRLNTDCAVVSYNVIIPGSRIRYRHVSDTWSREGNRWKLKFQQSTINLWSATDFD